MTPPVGALFTTPVGAVAGLLFVVLLVAACVTDVRERRIPNRIVALLFVGGLAYTLTVAPSVGTLARALAAGAIGFTIWIPFYALRMLGAGDVKLFAAAAVWLTPTQVLRAGLYTALFGGVLSVVWLLLEYGAMHGLARSALAYRQPLGALATNRVGGESRRHIPYGIAMALGLSLTLWLSRGA